VRALTDLRSPTARAAEDVRRPDHDQPTRPPNQPGTGTAFRRLGLLLAGAALMVLGAAAWLLSVLLTAPLVLAGLWVWAREFDWAERLFRRVLRWARSLWRRARARPVRWGAMTAAGFGGTAAAYWLFLA